ncbi:carbonic anhydrase [Nilaparvata lugens]|uniref:carbonic anhydrase n=1 Tax=Nilaparvata lugens TaxID=108931 RepID=UPI00193CEA4E|nr:carbonic anhydrase [Nilaparvata lugens]
MGYYGRGGRTLSACLLNQSSSFSRIVLCFLLLILTVHASADWHYSEDSWTGVCRDGKRQSPVDLDEEKAKVEVTQPLIFLRYDRPVQANLSNNGHTVVLNVEQQCEVAIASGGLRGVYQLDEIHFHWEAEHTIVGNRYYKLIQSLSLQLSWITYEMLQEGRKYILGNGKVVLNVEQQCEVAIASGGLRGVYQLDEIHFHWEAEHTIVGNRLPLEVHFVHHNVLFNNISHALQHPQGLAVVAVLFHEVDFESSNMVPVLDALEETAGSVGESTRLAVPFSPATLLPDDRSRFYRYQGSLTTPPCTESVVWTVMHSSVPISKFQLEKFRTVNSTSGLLDANFRRTHPLNGRTIHLITDDEVDITDNEISAATTPHICHKTFIPIVALAAFTLSRF